MKAFFTDSDLKIDMINPTENYPAHRGYNIDPRAGAGALSLLSSSLIGHIDYFILYFAYFIHNIVIHYRYTSILHWYTRYLQLHTSLPQVYNSFPKMYTALPKMYTPLPQMYTGLPQMYTGLLKMYTALPQMYTALPKMYTPLPQMYTGLPQMYTDTYNFYSMLYFSCLRRINTYVIFCNEILNKVTKPYLSNIYTGILLTQINSCFIYCGTKLKRNVGDSESKSGRRNINTSRYYFL